MAGNKKGIIIELGIDITKFQKAINEAIKDGYRLANRVKDISKMLKFNPDDQALYTQGFKALGDSINNAKKKLENLNEIYKLAKKEFSEGKIGVDDLNRLQREIKRTENDIKRFQVAIEELKKKSSNFERLKAEIEKLDKEIKKTTDSLKKVNEALKLDPKNVDLITQKQALLQDSINKTKQKLDLVKQAQNEAVKEFAQGNIGREEYAKITAEVSKTRNELKNLILDTDKGYQSLKKLGQGAKDLGGKLDNIGRGLTRKVSLPIAGALALATKEAINLEDAMAGVRKTTDMSVPELQRMEEAFISISKTTPVTAKELANIGEMAGQLGIQKNNIVDFAKTISDLTIATNLTAEQGAMDLARFMSITGMTQDKVSNLGSTIVALGNNFATTETEIINMGLRLAAQGEIIGLTESEIMGLSASLSAVGLMAEQGGSSFSRVMMKINTAVTPTAQRLQELDSILAQTGYKLADVQNAIAIGGELGKQKLDEIASSLNMTTEDLVEMVSETQNVNEKLRVLGDVSGLGAEKFARLWKEKPIEAIEAFLTGLSKMKDGNEDLAIVFDDLDMKAIRESDTLQRLTGAHGMLSEAVNTATEAYESNIALQREVEIFNATTGNQLKILKNEFTSVALKIGKALIPTLKDLIGWLKGLAERLENMSPDQVERLLKTLLGFVTVGPILSGVGKALMGFGKATDGILKVKNAMTALKLGTTSVTSISGLFAKALVSLKGGTTVATAGTTALTTGLATAKGVTVATTTATTGLVGGLGGLSAILTGGAIVAGIAALGYGIYKLHDYMSETALQSDIFGEHVSQGTQKAVLGFLDLSNQATISLNELKWSGIVVSQEAVDGIVGNYETLGGEISAKIEEQKVIANESLTQMYTELGVLDDEETVNILTRIDQRYTDMQTSTNEGVARIKEILQLASDEKRGLYQTEYEEIIGIQTQMKNDGITLLTENAYENGIIRQRMRDESSVLSAEMASEVVKQAVKTRDETITKAEEEYNERIRIAEQLRLDGTRESQQMADEIINKAREQRDNTIKSANEQFEGVISTAKEQSREHIHEVDWETGEIHNKWETFKAKLKYLHEKTKDETLKTWRDSLNQMNNDTSSGLATVTSTANRSLGDLAWSFSKVAGEIATYVSRIWSNVTSANNARASLGGGNFSRAYSSRGGSTYTAYATGAIFTRPTMFATPYGNKLVGEAGAEAVLPIEKLDGIVANALIKANGVNTNSGITITGNTFVVREETDIEKIAQQLEKLISRRKRGRGIV